MAYSLNFHGPKHEAEQSLKAQAEFQSAGVTSQAERDQLQQELAAAKTHIDTLAGDTDLVSVSLNGHSSSSPSGIALFRSMGVSIGRGVAPKPLPEAARADPRAQIPSTAVDSSRPIG